MIQKILEIGTYILHLDRIHFMMVIFQVEPQGFDYNHSSFQQFDYNHGGEYQVSA